MKEVTVEILNDLDEQVAIEGINVLANYDFLFSQVTMEDEFRPRLKEILNNAIDSRISVSQQARLSRLQGPLLHRLDQLGLLTTELTDQLFHFFSICLREPVVVATEQSTMKDDDDIGLSVKEYYQNKQQDSQNILLNAVYNLPCFYKLLGRRIYKRQNRPLAA